MNLLLSPHNDDAVLFCSWTLLRERPHCAVIFDSCVQFNRGNPVTAIMRREEDAQAFGELGLTTPEFLGLPDSMTSDAEEAVTFELRTRYHDKPEHVWAPAFEGFGHPQHNAVGAAAHALWPGRVTHYMTYTTAGKSCGLEVKPESGDWIKRKLRALACYETQIDIERLGCRAHFMRDLYEYYA